MILKPDRRLWTPPRSLVTPRRKQLGFFTPMGFMRPSFKVDAADFDGTNDYMTRGAGLTGAADSKQGLLSAWVRLDGGDGSQFFILDGPPSRFFFVRLTSNVFRIEAASAVPATVLRIDTVGTYTASGTWRHVLASWDLAISAEHLYVNDVSDLTVATSTDAAIDYTIANWAIGATTAGTSKFNGALAEFYFAPGQYLDFSVEANRRKFISASGKPVDLGTDGAKPTGTPPIVYQHLQKGETVANFATNRGTGGDFTITGTLETASTSPSD